MRTFVPCQDKTYCAEGRGVQVIALADGAGSAKLSHLGAEIVSREICHYMMKNFTCLMELDAAPQVRHDIITYLISKLQIVADQKGCDLADLACTLLVAAVSKNSYIVLHLGDGVIACFAHDDIKVASLPDNGEYANSTVFVTSASAENSLRLLRGKLGGISGFALMSDGAASGFFQKQTRMFAPALKSLMLRCSDMRVQQLEDSASRVLEQIRDTHTSDDCSVAIMAVLNGAWSDFRKLPVAERFKLLQIASSWKRRIHRAAQCRRSEKILDEMPCTIHELSARCGLHVRFLKRRLRRLEQAGCVIYRNGYVDRA